MVKWLRGIIAVVVCEVALRIAGFGHPLLYEASASGYEMKPDQTIRILSKKTHVNHYGMRGPDIELLPPPGTLRILCLGDSVMNGGTQVNDTETVPMMLQKALYRPDRHAEVLNASAGGWAPSNEAAWLTAHGTFHAAYIILEINEKDLDQPFAPVSTLSENPSFPTRAPLSAIFAVTKRYVLPKLGLGHAADPGSTATTFRSENVAPVLSAIDTIRRSALRDHAHLILLYWDLAHPTHNAAVVQARDQLFRFASEKQIPIVRPNLNAHGDVDKIYRDEVHPNAEGNSIIADNISLYIKGMISVHMTGSKT